MDYKAMNNFVHICPNCLSGRYKISFIECMYKSRCMSGVPQEILASSDDPFYMAAFRSKKLKRRNRRIMHMLRAQKLIGKN